MNLEILTRKAVGTTKATPLLFVHGAWHGAWCWDEYFMPYLARQGYDCYALSLRGHGKSENNKSLRWTSVHDYVADVEQVASSLSTAPVLIGHSMGGYVLQKYLETHSAAGGVVMASIPHTGSLASILRATMRHPLALLKTSLTMTMVHAVATPRLSKDLFFSDAMPDEQARRYHDRLQDESFRVIVLDAALLNLPRPRRIKTPMLVLGAAHDRVFTISEIQATARAYGTQAIIFPDMAHDMMLEAGWQAVANKIIDWLGERRL